MKPSRSFLPVSRRSVLLASVVIALAALAAYFNSFSVPFIFDDTPSIVNNATIRHLSRLGDILVGPPWAAITVNGRPLLNLTLALNYAVGGLHVGGYHGANLAVHVLAGIVLFGVVRRSLLQPILIARFGDVSLPLAFSVALLWTLHPLQTEAVTYVVQRAESQVGLCYLLTLYAFIRGAASSRPWRGYGLCLAFCALGMMAKEVMATAPFMILLYDRTFVAGSFARAWRERWRLYAGLASTWLILAWLMLGPGSRGEAGAFVNGTSWHAYALTQFVVILHYLRLILWPFPLILDYGGAVLEHDMMRIVPSALIILTLVVATVVGLWRRPVLGFLGCWFFVILAPTSSIVPLADTMFEHRVYLSMAAVLVLFVVGIHAWIGKRGLWLLVALAVAFGVLSSSRNRDYRSEFVIWSDVLAKQPGNARAHNNLGSLWLAQDNLVEAEKCFKRAVQLWPTYPSANYNWGIVESRTGRSEEALAHFIAAIRVEDTFVDAYVNAGNMLLKLKRAPEALRQYEAALRLQPQSADLHYNLGLALDQLGRSADAAREYEAAANLDPARVETHLNLAAAKAREGDTGAAEHHYREAIRLQPGAVAYVGLGDLLVGVNRFPEAADVYQKALQTEPDNLHARFNLGNALLITERIDEAIVQYELILRAQPNEPGVLQNLQQARAMKQAARRNP